MTTVPKPSDELCHCNSETCNVLTYLHGEDGTCPACGDHGTSLRYGYAGPRKPPVPIPYRPHVQKD